MIIEYNKKIQVTSPKPYLNGGKPKPNPTLGKPNSTPQQVHTHEKDAPTEYQPSETTTQTIVHESWLRVVQTHQTSKISCQFSMQRGICITRFPKEISSSPKICFCQS